MTTRKKPGARRGRPPKFACEGCKFWSELIAKTDDDGALVALCLSDQSVHSQRYTHATSGCRFGEAGPSIDDPDLPVPPAVGLRKVAKNTAHESVS